MKALFNAVCDVYHKFKPRCATVYARATGKATVYLPDPQVMCADCRRTSIGRFRADDKHR